jgi:tellurite resistance protein TerC
MITASEIITAVPIIISLIIIEGLLSVDNALAIAALASHLPGRQKQLALKFGIVGAYALRGLALAFAAWIISNPWIRLIGAGYLIYLMCSHLGEQTEEDGDGAKRDRKLGLLMTVVQIEIMDLSLSLDNVVAAVAMSPKLWIVCAGVFIGILALRFLAGYCIKLLEKYPILAKTAFLLVGYVGCLLATEEIGRMLGHRIEIGAAAKFIGIALIVAATIFYSKNAALQSLFGPAVAIAKPGMRIVVGSVEIPFWPLRKLIRMVKAENPAAAVD